MEYKDSILDELKMALVKKLFPYYLKELEFRYNNRDDIFEKLIEVMISECK